MTAQRKVLIEKIKRKTDWRYSTREVERMFKLCNKNVQSAIEVLRLATWRTEFFNQQKSRNS